MTVTLSSSRKICRYCHRSRRAPGSSPVVGSSSSKHCRMVEQALGQLQPALHSAGKSLGFFLGAVRQARRGPAFPQCAISVPRRAIRKDDPDATDFQRRSTSRQYSGPGTRPRSDVVIRLGSLAASNPMMTARPPPGNHQSREDAEHRGLAAAVRSEQSEQLGVADVERNSIQGGAAVIAMDEVLYRNHGRKYGRGAVLRVERDVIGGFRDHRVFYLEPSSCAWCADAPPGRGRPMRPSLRVEHHQGEEQAANRAPWPARAAVPAVWSGHCSVANSTMPAASRNRAGQFPAPGPRPGTVCPDIPRKAGNRLMGISATEYSRIWRARGLAVRFHHRQHPNSAVIVILAIEPRDGIKVRELPEEDDGKHYQRAPLQAAPRGGPAQHARHGSRKSAYKGANRVNLLQRRIGAEIDGRRGQRQPCSQRIQRETRGRGRRRASSERLPAWHARIQSVRPGWGAARCGACGCPCPTPSLHSARRLRPKPGQSPAECETATTKGKRRQTSMLRSSIRTTRS